jgi:uncharacterized LabA/DUF88 family protein
MSSAVLIDAGFFLKRFRKVYRDRDATDPRAVARTLHTMALEHLHQKNEIQRRTLYRILVYDCAPLDKRVHTPVTGRSLNFGKSETATFRLAFHRELRCLRKVALRLGHLLDRKSWVLDPERTKELLKRKITVDDLTDDDYHYDTVQKGVDMKIGLDIAALTHKRMVDQIILVSGDSDFVPAAKLARRGGIDFILDPMWRRIRSDLHEHIDGLRSTSPKPPTPLPV